MKVVMILGAKSESKESKSTHGCYHDELGSASILNRPISAHCSGAGSGTSELHVADVSSGRLVGSETWVTLADAIGCVFRIESGALVNVRCCCCSAVVVVHPVDFAEVTVSVGVRLVL